MSMNEVVKKLSQAIDKQADKAKTTAYDTPATVRRIEGDTAWVHIPGGVDETPVKLTISAKEGDQVQVRVSGGSAFMVGNGTNPPTDDARANEAYTVATVAEGAAQNALGNAALAKEAADSAQASASAAESAAGDAVIAAGDAQTAAGNAQTAADSALVNLSTVQDVVGVLNWITAHGTMTLTSDVTVNPAHVYFIVDAGGDYVVGGTHYSIVSEPKDAELSTYYELTVDESVQNYVATHIVVDTEGLWIVPDAGGNKVLIATGSGSTYKTAGTYIVGKVNDVDTVLAGFTSDGVQIGQNDGTSKMIIGSDSVVCYNGDSVPSFSVDMDGGSTITPAKYPMSAGKGGQGVKIPTTEEVIISHTKIYDVFDISTGTFKVESPSFFFYVKSAADKVLDVQSTFNVKNYEILDADISGDKYGIIVNGKNSTFTVGTNKTYTIEIYIKIKKDNSYQYIIAQLVTSYDASDNSVTCSLKARSTNSAVNLDWIYFSISITCGIPTKAPAFVFGSNVSETLGDFSSSLGRELYSTGSNQTVIGKYNIEDTNSDYAAIIGNGTADDARSNALTVDWSGNVDIASGAKYKINGNDLAASDVGALAEDSNGDLSVTRNITAGGDITATGDVTDGSGNTLAAVAGATVTTKNTASKAVSNNTRTELTNVALGPGVWTVTCHASYPTNTTGRRWLGCILGAIADISEFAVQSPPASGGATRMEVSAIVTNSTSSTQTFRLAGYQTSGSSLTVTDIHITAVRVGSPTA